MHHIGHSLRECGFRELCLMSLIGVVVSVFVLVLLL
jgi:hypothetical protein